MQRRFQQLDVFAGAGPVSGNPLAVVVDGDGLDDAQMAAFARWTNLSETTFLLPPTDPAADYRVRIFTPGGELPFAGHPTLGSAHAFLATGGDPKKPGPLVQPCAIGLATLKREGARLAFAAPPLKKSGAVADAALRAQAARSLRLAESELLDLQWVDNGPGWMVARLKDAGLLMTSHSAETIRSYCTSGLVLERGRARYFANVDEAIDVHERNMAAA